jgi:hypothetical protein
MKKILWVILLYPFLFINVNGQYGTGFTPQYIHSINVGMMMSNYDKNTIMAPGLTYRARLNLMKFSFRTSLSIEVPLTIGYTLDPIPSDDQIAYEIPVSVNFNVGYGSALVTRRTFGGFLGIGYAYNSISNEGYNLVTDKPILFNATEGIMFQAGIRALMFGNYGFTAGGYTILGSEDNVVFGVRAGVIFNLLE